ncbi:MAG TPA: lasso peptide biosynthesis B2 protein [Anaerolineae bacterium]|nr:lasso peptide biosynthesis B2 protein [Anaerolineae bacterium]
MKARLRHIGLALAALPGLMISARRRALFREMRAFARNLPAVLKSPLPAAMQQITPLSQPSGDSEPVVRDLADLAALLDRRSPLGLCLRRSLTRYHFLRRAGVPVVVRYGAKFVDGKPDREITGHAWLTLDGHPYHEADENWRGFTVMITWPE